MRWHSLWSLTCGVTGFASSLGVMIALRILLGVGESIYLPGGMKIVSVLFHSKDRGLASGLINCGTRAGLAFGAPLIASLVVAFGWKEGVLYRRIQRPDLAGPAVIRISFGRKHGRVCTGDSVRLNHPLVNVEPFRLDDLMPAECQQLLRKHRCTVCRHGDFLD
jgi:nitrate/nitrite transporter NarK